jgi:hypothetical protein
LSSIALLADVGITTYLDEDPVPFESPNEEIRFTMPDNSISQFNIVELVRRDGCNGFNALP